MRIKQIILETTMEHLEDFLVENYWKCAIIFKFDFKPRGFFVIVVVF